MTSLQGISSVPNMKIPVSSDLLGFSLKITTFARSLRKEKKSFSDFVKGWYISKK